MRVGELRKRIEPKNAPLTVIRVLLFGVSSIFGLVAATTTLAQETKMELPKEKQTTLGLYVTAKEAYEKWKAEPEKVKIFDVRTTEEYLFIGHAEMAWNIPFGSTDVSVGCGQEKAPNETESRFPLPGERSCPVHRHDPGHVPVRGAQCDGRKPTCRGWVPQRLQHHRWNGRVMQWRNPAASFRASG